MVASATSIPVMARRVVSCPSARQLSAAAAGHRAQCCQAVSVSFGRIPSGAGQTRSATITVTNTTGNLLTAAIDGDASKFATTAIPAGETVTVAVTGTSAKGQLAGRYWATLRISDSSGEVC